MSLQIKIWGTRGSLPAPHSPAVLAERSQYLLDAFFSAGHTKASDIAKFLKSVPPYRLGGFGGNTPCLSVKSKKQSVIIDAGSGIRELGYELMQGASAHGKAELHLFFTHFHWDHLMGLPFFTPLFIPGNTVHVYAVQKDLPDVFKTIFKKPYFPIPLEELQAKIVYHSLKPREPHPFEDMVITPYELDHPDPCWGYKISSGGRTLSYCVDTEGTRVSREKLGADLPLYQGIDVMVFDAQYTIMETLEKINWGHASASIGLDLAVREGIKKVIFMHHDPASSDEKIAIAEAEARRYFKTLKAGRDLDWCFAQEGMTFDV